MINEIITQRKKMLYCLFHRFLKEFFSNCLITLSQKLELTNFTTEKNNERLNQNNKDLEGLEFIRKEVFLDIYIDI